MALETGSYISALVSTNPVGATDPKSQGDDHIRFIKAKLLETFANVTGAVTASHTELNLVAGATGGLATLSVSFAALATLVSQMGTLSTSVTSSDITGSIRTPVLKTQAGFTAGTFTAATVVVSNKGVITNITAGSAAATPAYQKTKLTTGDVSTTSTSLVDMTGVTVTITTGARPVHISFSGSTSGAATAITTFNVDIDGTLQFGTSGIAYQLYGSSGYLVCIAFDSDVLTAGEHTIKIQWKVNSGTGVMAASSTCPAILSVHEIV